MLRLSHEQVNALLAASLTNGTPLAGNIFACRSCGQQVILVGDTHEELRRDAVREGYWPERCLCRDCAGPELRAEADRATDRVRRKWARAAYVVHARLVLGKTFEAIGAELGITKAHAHQLYQTSSTAWRAAKAVRKTTRG